MQRTIRTMTVTLLIAATAAAANAPDYWVNLMRGNRRYVRGSLVYAHLRTQRRATRDHQNPPVTVVSCSDSRVPPELMFDQSIGGLFVIRVAGNVIDAFNLASVEYAVAHGYTKLIVVIGHESCGAVKAALSDDDPGSPSLEALVAKIRENLGGRKPPIQEAVEINAHASAKQLVEQSKIIRDAVNDGKVTIVTAYYGFDGRVRRLD